MGFFHSLYNAQLSDKYENLLKDKWFNDDYPILGQEYQYVGDWHNNTIHISSVAIHVGMVDMHTLLTWPCQLLLNIYDSHVE